MTFITYRGSRAMTIILQLLCLFLDWTSASPLLKRDFPPVGACDGGQCSGRLHDPSVVYRADTKTYYRFCTNDGINTATAPAISGPWTDLGAALPDGSNIDLPGNKDLWAPDVFEFDGTYYMYYSVSEMGSKNSDIGVASSATMDPGSWTDHGTIGIPTDARYNKIDANLFMHTADNPNFVLNFGSFWSNIFQVSMSNPPLRVSSEVVHLAQNTSSRPAGLVPGSMEGAYEFQWKGFYYLFFSSGNCCNELGDGLAPPGEEYKVMICRSSEYGGSFVDQSGKDCLTQNGGTVVLESHHDVYAPGGQGVMFDPNLQSVVMYYHFVRPSVSYMYDDFFFGWNKLDFSSGWPVVVA